ncbi:hypothetical protein BD770DRAFT_386698 [Pilaira anomala]|nr:hypothetical protein BD770DRAFT_386698 [Pilaira anomala]
MPRPSRTFESVADHHHSARLPYSRNDQNGGSITPAPSQENSSACNYINDFSLDTSSVDTSSLDNSLNSKANVKWNDKITWIFLQIMLAINDPLNDATDNTLLKENIWDRALVCFRKQLEINYNDTTAEEITGFLDSRFDVKNMQDQWNRMIENYRDLKAENELTGIGGVHSSVTWPFYDEVGQILANDRNVHPEIVISTSINGKGPEMVTINRNEPHIRESMSTEDKERMIKENARRRGVVHMSIQQIQEKILVPARRNARICNTDNQGTTSSRSLSNVTGAGRRTRRRVERAEEQDSFNSGGNSGEINSSNDIRSLIDDIVTRSNQNTQENIDYFHRLALERDEARLNIIKKILDEQRRLDQEERENYFKHRNNPPC